MLIRTIIISTRLQERALANAEQNSRQKTYVLNLQKENDILCLGKELLGDLGMNYVEWKCYSLDFIYKINYFTL